MFRTSRLTLLAGALTLGALILAAPQTARAQNVIFDNFDVDEGHFNQAPTFSGNNAGIHPTSTADRVTTDGPIQFPGHERLVIVTNGAAGGLRCRFLSGAGSQANNTSFTTTSGEDGWIGCFIKTTNSGWNVQIWIEGLVNTAGQINGGVPKNIIADGEWHPYEWNLDDHSGGTDGWGSIPSIITGSATVSNTSHTVDSLFFRNPQSTPVDQINVFYIDYVSKTASGTISNLITALCLNTPGVVVTGGPISTNTTTVTVSGAVAGATNITVYQNTGFGFTNIVGVKNTGITAGNNTVTVSGLIKNAQLGATQNKDGQESCAPQSGLFVGGGANPSLKMALSIKETALTGPVGADGTTAGADLHFLGATTTSAGSPANAATFFPSNGWQTVTFQRGAIESMGDGPTNASGTIVAGNGYKALIDTVDNATNAVGSLFRRRRL